MKKLALLFVVPLLACEAMKERPITVREVRLIVTAEALTEWGLPDLDPRAQKIGRNHEMDGSLRYDCEYDSDHIPNAKRDLYFSSGAHYFPTDIQAQERFKETVASYKRGAESVRGRYVHVQPHLLKMGDESYAAYIQNGKNIVGNIFVIRRGRTLHELVVGGIYFDEQAGVHRLFAPIVAASEEFEKSSS